MSESRVHRHRNVISVLLTIFSALTFIGGTVLLIALIGSAQAVPGYEMFFQLAGIPNLAGMVLRPVQAVMINLGILLFVVMSAIAALLYTAGRLVARHADLVERVRGLEDRVTALEGQN
jgi:hypothetical protein